MNELSAFAHGLYEVRDDDGRLVECGPIVRVSIYDRQLTVELRERWRSGPKAWHRISPDYLELNLAGLYVREIIDHSYTDRTKICVSFGDERIILVTPEGYRLTGEQLRRIKSH